MSILLTVTFIFFSCEKDNGQEQDKSKLLLGSWSYTVGSASCRDRSVLTFESTGVYSEKNEGSCLGWLPDPIRGTWKLVEDQSIIIFKSQGTESRRTIVSLSDRELVLRISSGEETKYTR